VEHLSVAQVVTVDELLVGEDVPVGVEDALRQARRARRGVELGRIVGGGVDGANAVEPRPSNSSSRISWC